MKQKMENYFGEKTAQCEKEGSKLQNDMEKLANDMKSYNERLQKTVKDIHINTSEFEASIKNKKPSNAP